RPGHRLHSIVDRKDGGPGHVRGVRRHPPGHRATALRRLFSKGTGPPGQKADAGGVELGAARRGAPVNLPETAGSSAPKTPEPPVMSRAGSSTARSLGPSSRVAVIGGGLGGLSAAGHLARRGWDVTLFEQSNVLGGKATRWIQDGLTLDLGPTLLTFPQVVE